MYTKAGDKGTTSIIGAKHLKKEHLIFSVLGDIDELNSHIGLLCQYASNETILKNLRVIQSRLIDIGSIISIIKYSDSMPVLLNADVTALEHQIDTYESKNSKLTTFILPGATKEDAQCHICRTLTRKVERSICALISSNCDNLFSTMDEFDVTNYKNNIQFIIPYFNRMSDMFFALARNMSGDDIRASDYRPDYE